MADPFQVLLYYKYTHIADPHAFAGEQRLLCDRLGLRGRIIIAREGINGTVSGEKAATEGYMAATLANASMAGMSFKIDLAQEHVFPKMSIKVRREIVSLQLDNEEDIDPEELTAKHLSPAEFQEAMTQDGAVLLDGRNNYESDLGRFRGALCPDLDNFRDFPEWIRENLGDAKDKPVLTYCTGGIRCEKLSGFLLKEGFSNVAQLDGGIVSYGKDPATRGQDFEGQCYVFDERLGVSVNEVNPKVVARCRGCDEPCERYVNCGLSPCNKRIFLCEGCEGTSGRFCGVECREATGDKLAL